MAGHGQIAHVIMPSVRADDALRHAEVDAMRMIVTPAESARRASRLCVIAYAKTGGEDGLTCVRDIKRI